MPRQGWLSNVQISQNTHEFRKLIDDGICMIRYAVPITPEPNRGHTCILGTLHIIDGVVAHKCAFLNLHAHFVGNRLKDSLIRFAQPFRF